MTCGVKVPLHICRGKTWSKPFRWGQSRKVYKPITAATVAAPCVMTVPSHGIPDGWVYQVANAKGMTELNTESVYRQAIVLDANSVEINELDASALDPYTGGGILSYPMPVDLTGYTARMHARESVDSTTTIFTLTSPAGIVIDNTLKLITPQLTAVATAALTEFAGVYDIEMVDALDRVYLLAYGSLEIITEVTR